MWMNIIVFFTTFIVFLGEATIHYNIGHEEEKFVWPSGKHMLYILGTVATFSLINAVLVWGIGKFFNKK